MALMSRKVDYALLILSYLHRHPEGKCARATAEHFGLSRAFVANILKELCQKGFVVSHRGARGGYVLHRPLERVSLAELMEALDDTFYLTECTREPAGAGCCFVDVCPVRDPIAEVHRRVAEVLRKVTLAELFEGGLPPPDTERLEDFALTEAIREGRKTGFATRDEVFRLLK
jgi:Rrf2 family protein